MLVPVELSVHIGCVGVKDAQHPNTNNNGNNKIDLFIKIKKRKEK